MVVRNLALVLAAGLLATGAAWAGDGSGKSEAGKSEDRLQGSPDAAGFKGDGAGGSSGSSGSR